MTKQKADLLQGTLDLLILNAPGPLYGYGIIQRIRQLSDELLEVEQGSLTRRSTGSSSAAESVPGGR